MKPGTGVVEKAKPKRGGKNRVRMSCAEVMAVLEEQGTAQNRKIYARHGAREPMFGVSFGNLNKLQKKIKRDHELAFQLWETGNMDAMTLALKVMDPELVTRADAERMVSGLSYYMLVDILVSEVVVHNGYAHDLLEQWTASGEEYVKRAGYSILSNLARRENGLSDEALVNYLQTIEREIHNAPNRARQMMNIAVLAIGIRGGKLYEQALAAARRIGPVTVDHGETSCETYDVAAKLTDETYLARAKKSLGF